MTAVNGAHANADARTVAGFGDEWSRFDQSGLSDDERRAIYHEYFGIFPWDEISPESSVGADLGCGSGRWATLVAPRVKKLYLVDASQEALGVARRNLAGFDNTEFLHCSIGELPLPDASLDFAYSLGVLHHMPDTAGAIRAIARKLKPGAPLLLYLYYAFDNSPPWYRAVWKCTDLVRRVISRLPPALRHLASQLLAAQLYWPLARSAAVLDRIGLLPRFWPLSQYRDKSFYVMRTDALDRFGTRLEQRFTQAEITRMLTAAGFDRIQFSDAPPYWVSLSFRS